MVYRLADQESGNIVHLTLIVKARFCTAVGSSCSGLLGNDYSPVIGTNKSFVPRIVAQKMGLV